MYLEDMTPYRCKSYENKGFFFIFPKQLNIGWLDREHPFPQGHISDELLQKLKEMIFLDLKEYDETKKGCFDQHKAVKINTMHLRASPVPCPLCADGTHVITVSPEGVSGYKGTESETLGLSEMGIPAVQQGYYFAFPTMLYHYMTVHDYCPPDEFLRALQQFDLEKPFNIDDKQHSGEFYEVSADELQRIDEQQRLLNRQRLMLE